MNRLGIESLNAGAPDLRLSGDHRPTYTQRRRTQMAGGGIMGSNAGSMLVAPTADGSRPGYGIWGDIWDKGKDFVTEKVLPKAVDWLGDKAKDWLGGGDKGPSSPPITSADYPPGYTGPMLSGMPQGSPGQMNPYTPPPFPTSENWIQDIFGGAPQEIQQDPGFWKKLGQTIWPGGETGYGDIYKGLQAAEPTGLEKIGIGGNQGVWDPGAGAPQYYPPRGEEVPAWKKLLQTVVPGGETGYLDLYGGGGGGTGQGVNIAVPMGIGAAAGLYQKKIS